MILWYFVALHPSSANVLFSTSKAKHFSFCGIIYFLQTFLNMQSIVHFSCQLQLKSIYAFSFLKKIFTHIWTSFFWHQSFLRRTIPSSIPISIGVCKQLWHAKKEMLLLHSYFSMSTRYLWLFLRLNRFLHQPQWPQGGTGHCSGLKTVQPWHWPQWSASSYFAENIIKCSSF